MNKLLNTRNIHTVIFNKKEKNPKAWLVKHKLKGYKKGGEYIIRDKKKYGGYISVKKDNALIIFGIT